MQFDELKELCMALLELVPNGRMELHEAEELAPKFQRIRADIASVQLELEMNRNKFKAVSKTQYKNAILTVTEKWTAAQKEAAAKADPDFLNTVESLDNLESRIDYCKTMSDVFNNFHIFYRQISRGE
jgi:molecular chaperone GrpE (heat shock protein)